MSLHRVRGIASLVFSTDAAHTPAEARPVGRPALENLASAAPKKDVHLEPPAMSKAVEEDFRVFQHITSQWIDRVLDDALLPRVAEEKDKFDLLGGAKAVMDLMAAFQEAHDYVLSVLASSDTTSFGFVGLWLGYGKDIGKEVVRHEKAQTKFSSNRLHFTLMNMISRDIVTDPWDFLEKIRTGPGYEETSKAFKAKYGEDKKAWDEIFSDVADVMEAILPHVRSPIVVMVRGILNEAYGAGDKIVSGDLIDKGGLKASGKSPAERRLDPWPVFPLIHTDVKTSMMRAGSEVMARSLDLGGEDQLKLVQECVNVQSVLRSGRDLDAQIAGDGIIDQMVTFGTCWAMSGFPLLRPTHTLSASLMATHVPEDQIGDLQAPWSTFFVEIPDGLVPVLQIAEKSLALVPRFIGVLSSPNGYLVVVACNVPEIGGFCFFERAIVKLSEIPALTFSDPKRSDLGKDKALELHATFKLLLRLLIQSIIEVDTVAMKRMIAKGPPAQTVPAVPSKVAGREKGSLPKTWAIELRRDVKVDARKWVRDYVASGGKSPSVQTLVRGHRKRQPYGPHALNLRKWIHIEAFWRGPEDAPIVVRGHALKEEAVK